MALVLPVLALLMAGAAEFGRAMMVRQLLTNSARHGARLAARDGSAPADVEQDVKAFVAEALKVADESIAVQIDVAPVPGRCESPQQVPSESTGNLVRVRVQVPFKQVAYVSGSFLEGNTLEGSYAMRCR